MKGKLIYDEENDLIHIEYEINLIPVEYEKNNIRKKIIKCLPLHPDDINSKSFSIINNNDELEFEIEEVIKTSGISRYAKLK
jgi:hypothetical protein